MITLITDPAVDFAPPRSQTAAKEGASKGKLRGGKRCETWLGRGEKGLPDKENRLKEK